MIVVHQTHGRRLLLGQKGPGVTLVSTRELILVCYASSMEPPIPGITCYQALSHNETRSFCCW